MVVGPVDAATPQAFERVIGGTAGRDDGQFECPCGVAVLGGERLAVADGEGNRVAVLHSSTQNSVVDRHFDSFRLISLLCST